MNIINKVTREINEIADIICNNCGDSCKGDLGNFNGLIQASVYGGFDSTHLEDGQAYEFSICEKCLDEMFQKFKYKP